MMALVSGATWASPGICHWSRHLLDRKPLPGCVSSLPVHLFENLVKFLKTEVIKYNLVKRPCYVLEIGSRWKLLYHFQPDSLIFFFTFLKIFFSALCAIHLDEDTNFCQLLHSLKTAVCSPCKARESTRKHTWRQESYEFSFSTFLVNQG